MENFPPPDATRRFQVDACLIRLSDNQFWGFARPTKRLVPVVNVERDSFGRIAETIAAGVETSYPRAIRMLLEELVTANFELTIEARYEAFLCLAVGLLRLAHEIGEAAARSILSVDRSEIPRLVDEVLTVATGRIDAPTRKIQVDDVA